MRWPAALSTVYCLLFASIVLALTSCSLPREEGGWRHTLWLHYRANRPPWGSGLLGGDHVSCVSRIEGEIYIATSKGLSRWRGSSFANYHPRPGPAGEKVLWLFSLPGGVAAAGPQGLSLFNGLEWRQTAIAMPGEITAAAGFKGVAFLAGEGFSLALDGERQKPFPYPEKVTEVRLLYGCEDRLVAITHKELVAWRGVPGETQPRVVPLPVGAGQVNGVTVGKHIWLAASGGVYSLDAAGAWHSYPAPVLGTRERGADAITGNGDELWLACGAELALLSEKDLLRQNWHSTIYGRKSGLPRAVISSICAWDREVWVGTRGRGIARLKRPYPVRRAGEQSSSRTVE